MSSNQPPDDDRVSLTDLAQRAGMPQELVTRLISKGRLTVIGARGRYRVVAADEAALVVRAARVAHRSGLPLAQLLDAVRSGAVRENGDGSMTLVAPDESTDDQEGELAA